jgi:hypothetical protein
MVESKEEAGAADALFAKVLVEPYVPDIQRINASVENVLEQQKKLVKEVEAVKGELDWCSDLGELGQLEATMDLVPHYTYKAQQCARDMQQIRQRVAKAKEKTMKLIRAQEKRKK